MADDRVDEAARAIYAVPPEQFLAKRTELAKRARSAGDAATAAQIEKLRKPTVGAWVVNSYVLAEPTAVERLGDLGDRLRAAQEALDPAALRDLTSERRKLVDELTRRALAQADKRQPPAGLRDEVAGTFEAALADPVIAGQLGRLQRSQQWSGFGFLPAGTPQLTVVRGGGKTAASEGSGQKSPAKAPPKKSAAERRKEQKAIADAQRVLDEAETAYRAAETAERDLSTRVKQLGKKLAKLQDELDAARDSLEAARKEVAATKGRRREARSALDRAERAGRG